MGKQAHEREHPLRSCRPAFDESWIQIDRRTLIEDIGAQILARCIEETTGQMRRLLSPCQTCGTSGLRPGYEESAEQCRGCRGAGWKIKPGVAHALNQLLETG